jgi:hypothetical protein
MTATLEEALVSFLTSYAPLTALISTRVIPFDMPKGTTLPCVTFQRIDTPRLLTHDSSGATGDLATPRLQLDAWATTYSAAKAIADVLRGGLNGKKGTLGSGNYAITVSAILIDGEIPIPEPDVSAYRVMSQYIVWLEEA